MVWWCFCGGGVMAFLCCVCGGVFAVVFLWWCSCGGVFVVVWCSTGVVLEWCFCGHVFLVVFLW